MQLEDWYRKDAEHAEDMGEDIVAVVVLAVWYH